MAARDYCARDGRTGQDLVESCLTVTARCASKREITHQSQQLLRVLPIVLLAVVVAALGSHADAFVGLVLGLALICGAAFIYLVVRAVNQRPLDHPRLQNISPSTSAAAAAAFILFGMVMVPSAIAALSSPVAAGWLPVIVIFTLPWMAIAAIVGALIGRFASATSKSAVGAAIGFAVALPIGFLAAVLFRSPAEPLANSFVPIVFAVVPGAMAGAVGTILARPRRLLPGWRAYLSRGDLAIFAGLLGSVPIFWASWLLL